MHISKRMLRSVAMLGIVLIGGVALADGANGMPYAEPFSSITDGDMITNTTGWAAGEGDTSYVTNLASVTYSLPEGLLFPITYDHETDNKVLNLNTGTSALTNSFDGVTFSPGVPLYIDSMVSFKTSDTDPVSVTNDINVKAAVFVNQNSNLVVYCGSYSGEDFGPPQFAVTTNTVIPDQWYRLTVQLDATTGEGGTAQAFKIKLNGTAIESDVAYSDNWAEEFTTAPTTGNWFLSAANWPGATSSTTTNVTALVFQGTGMFDDLVVTNNAPEQFGVTETFWYLTVAKTGNGTVAPVVGTYAVLVGNSTNVVATADDWYRITSLSVNGSPVGAAVDAKAYTNEVATGTAGQTNTVDVVFGDPANATLYSGVSNEWVKAKLLTEAQAAADGNLATDYLLNVDPSSAYTADDFVISSVNVDGSTITVVTKLTNVTPLPTTINGKLQVEGKTSITNADWDVIGAATINNASFTASGVCTNTFTDSTYKFYKAVITPLP